MRSIDYSSYSPVGFLMEESGASLMEYALIAAIIAVVSALVLLALYKKT